MILKKKKIEKSKLTHQTRDSDYEIRIKKIIKKTNSQKKKKTIQVNNIFQKGNNEFPPQLINYC